jgi:hypothetical protein
MERATLTTCWECNASTYWPIAVTLEVPTGRLGPIMLCPRCYQVHYLLLVAEASLGTVPRQAPPRGELDPGECPLML